MKLIECPNCGGEGATWYDTADARGEHTTKHERCELCAGSGEVEECAECSGRGEVERSEAIGTTTRDECWNEACGECDGTGWHPIGA